MTFSNIGNVKSLFALLDHYSYSQYVEGPSSPLSPEVLQILKAGKGFRFAVEYLLRIINDNLNDKNEINRQFDLFDPQTSVTITGEMLLQKVLYNPETREDLQSALKKVQSTSISEKSKKALSDLFLILDYLDSKKSFLMGKRMPSEFTRSFNSRSTATTLNEIYSSLTPADLAEIKKTLGIKETLSLDALSRNVLTDPSSDLDLRAAFIKLGIYGRLISVKSFAMVQQRPELIPTIAASKYELVIINQTRSNRGEEAYNSAEDVRRLHDAGKKVFCYMSAGEAEEHRYYWDSRWKQAKPFWMLDSNVEFQGAHIVKYWDKNWKKQFFQYLDHVIADGFDGVMLDCIEVYKSSAIIDAAETDNVDATEEMVRFVKEISQYAKSKNKDFKIIVQNAPELGTVPEYMQSVDAISQESVWFTWNQAYSHGAIGDIPMDKDTSLQIVQNLQVWKRSGKPVFIIDYAQDPHNIEVVRQNAAREGFVPFVSTKTLNTLP